MTGTLYGIGVGPGDPELISLKAQRVLQSLDEVWVPCNREAGDGLAWQVVRDHVRFDQTVVDVRVPMSHQRGAVEDFWSEQALRMKTVLEQGRSCGYICLGDPSLYSSFSYLLAAVKQAAPDVPVEIIPGISVINLLAARVQVPLAESRQNLAVIAGLREGDIDGRILQEMDNVLIMKAGRTLPQLLESETVKSREVYTGSRLCMDGEQFGPGMTGLRPEDLDYWTTVLVKKSR